MANTIDSMTPEAMLRGIIDGSLTELIDEMEISVEYNKLREMDRLTKINVPNVSALQVSTVRDCDALETLSGISITALNSAAIIGNPVLETVVVPKLADLPGGSVAGVMLRTVDIKGARIRNGFSGTSLAKLIIRNTGVSDLTVTLESTYFKSGGVAEKYTFRNPFTLILETAAHWTTRLLRTGLRCMREVLSPGSRSRAASTSITTPTELLSSNRKGVMVYG